MKMILEREDKKSYDVCPGLRFGDQLPASSLTVLPRRLNVERRSPGTTDKREDER
jgi:hypothetical protein